MALFGFTVSSLQWDLRSYTPPGGVKFLARLSLRGYNVKSVMHAEAKGGITVYRFYAKLNQNRGVQAKLGGYNSADPTVLLIDDLSMF